MKEQDKSAFMNWYRNGCISGTMEDALKKFRGLSFGEKRARVQERKCLIRGVDGSRSERNKFWQD